MQVQLTKIRQFNLSFIFLSFLLLFLCRERDLDLLLYFCLSLLRLLLLLRDLLRFFGTSSSESEDNSTTGLLEAVENTNIRY